MYDESGNYSVDSVFVDITESLSKTILESPVIQLISVLVIAGVVALGYKIVKTGKKDENWRVMLDDLKE